MGSRRSLEWPPWAQGSYRIRAGSLALSSDEFRVGRLAPSVGVHRNSNAGEIGSRGRRTPWRIYPYAVFPRGESNRLDLPPGMFAPSMDIAVLLLLPQ